MRSYAIFFEEFKKSIGDITPNMIYTFYYLEKMMIQHETPEVKRELIKFLVQLKPMYIDTFSKLLIDQLSKYHSRKRVDSDFDMGTNTSPVELARLIKKTFRSDMTRRNDLWNVCADNLVSLSQSNSLNTTILYIDRLNTCIHNANESMFYKLKDGYQLVQTMDVCKNFRDVRAFLPYVSRDYRDLYPKGNI